MSNFFWNWTKTADYQKITQVICLVTYCSFSEVSVFLAPFYLTLKSANVPNLELTWKVWFRYDHTCLSSRAVPFNLVKPWRRNRFNRKKTKEKSCFDQTMIGLDRLIKKILKPRIMVDQIFPAILGKRLPYSKNRPFSLSCCQNKLFSNKSCNCGQNKKRLTWKFVGTLGGRNLIKICRLD